jgi:hypothetical protein
VASADNESENIPDWYIAALIPAALAGYEIKA